MDATIEVRIPPEQQEGTHSVLQGWLKAPGDHVKANEPLAELETDKVVVEIAAPAEGVLQELLKSPGDEVLPGELVARLLPGPARSPAPPAARDLAPVEPGGTLTLQTPVPSPAEAPRTSPAVRRMLQQHGLAEDQLRGTGRGGRITARDVEAWLASGAAQAEPVQAPRGRMQPVDSMRRRIAEHMQRSMQSAPHVTSLFEADMSAVLAHRRETAAEAGARGCKLTLTAYFLAASAMAIEQVPEVNSRWHGDRLELYDDINIGIGTALGERGLVVPVMKGVQQLDLADIATRLEALTRRARDGRLAPADVQGGTFTISNHGVSGSLMATPIIINQPQSAILGVGKLEKRVIVREIDGQDSIQIRPMCFITLTLDHRVLDGYQANRFLGHLVSVLEHWPRDAGLALPR